MIRALGAPSFAVGAGLATAMVLQYLTLVFVLASAQAEQMEQYMSHMEMYQGKSQTERV